MASLTIKDENNKDLVLAVTDDTVALYKILTELKSSINILTSRMRINKKW